MKVKPNPSKSLLMALEQLIDARIELSRQNLKQLQQQGVMSGSLRHLKRAEAAREKVVRVLDRAFASRPPKAGTPRVP